MYYRRNGSFHYLWFIVLILVIIKLFLQIKRLS